MARAEDFDRELLVSFTWDNSDRAIEKHETFMGYSMITDPNTGEEFIGSNIWEFFDNLFNKTKCERAVVVTWNLGQLNTFMFPFLDSHKFIQLDHKPRKSGEDREVYMVGNNSGSIMYQVVIKMNGRIYEFRSMDQFIRDEKDVCVACYDMGLCDEITEPYIDDEGHYIHWDAWPDEIESLRDQNEKLRRLAHFLSEQSSIKWYARNITIGQMSQDIYLHQCYKDKEGEFYRRPELVFDANYPAIDFDEEEFHNRIRKHNAINYVMPEFLDKECNMPYFQIDAHQHYPTQMSQATFPKGEGEYFEGISQMPHNKMCALHVKIRFDNLEFWPWLDIFPCCNVMPDASIPENVPINDWIDVYLWDIELDFIERKLGENVDYVIMEGWAYDYSFLPGSNYFVNNYKARKIAKEEGQKGKIYYYKILNNVIFGKYSQGARFQDYTYTVENGKVVGHIVKKDQPKPSKLYYPPIASRILTLGRVALLDMAMKFGADNVIYMDTDSVMVKDTPETREILKTINMNDELGGWGIDAEGPRFHIYQPRWYKTELKDGGVKVRASGAGKFAGTTYDEIDCHQDVSTAFIKTILKGGMVYRYTEKKLSEVIF